MYNIVNKKHDNDRGDYEHNVWSKKVGENTF